MKARVPLSCAEKKALKTEINRQTAGIVQELSRNISALVLWQLHEQLGFGKKRLLRFQKEFAPLIQELKDHYEFKTDDEMEFLYLHKLKTECGITGEEIEGMFRFVAKVT